MQESNLLQVLLAGILSALVGFVWYHPRVFGTLWMRLSGLTPQAVEQGKRRMHMDEILAIIVGILASYVLSHLITALGVYNALGAIQLGFLLWVGFAVPALAGAVLWEQRPVILFAVNSVYWLVSIVAMSIILIL